MCGNLKVWFPLQLAMFVPHFLHLNLFMWNLVCVSLGSIYHRTWLAVVWWASFWCGKIIFSSPFCWLFQFHSPEVLSHFLSSWMSPAKFLVLWALVSTHTVKSSESRISYSWARYMRSWISLISHSWDGISTRWCQLSSRYEIFVDVAYASWWSICMHVKQNLRLAVEVINCMWLHYYIFSADLIVWLYFRLWLEMKLLLSFPSLKRSMVHWTGWFKCGTVSLGIVMVKIA